MATSNMPQNHCIFWRSESTLGFLLAVSFVMLLATSQNAMSMQTGGGIEVTSVILKLVADVDIPAREHGVLDSMLVTPNQQVTAGQVLAQINDDDHSMNLRKAKLELEIATSIASSDIQIRIAQEELRVAQLNLNRGEGSRERFSASLSASELDQLKLTATRAKLKLETAQLEMKNAKLKQQLVESEVKQAESVIARHKIISPLEGVVAAVQRDAGEWVEPGDVVLRVIGLSRLRAEGFVKANLISRDLLNADVQMFTVTSGGKERKFSGKVSFVSDEIDPVNQQILVWAEIENSDLRLRPGDRGRMVITK